MISPQSGLRTSESAVILMSKRLSSDDNRDRRSSFLWDWTFQAPTRRGCLRLTQGDAIWWTTPQYHSDTHYRTLTREDYPVVFLRSSKSGGPKGFAPIPSSGELPCGWQHHRRYSHGGFIKFPCICWFCRMKCFTVAGVQILPLTSSKKKVTQLMEDVRRHGH